MQPLSASRLALLIGGALLLGACLDPKPPASGTGGPVDPVAKASGTPADPDVAFLRKSRPGSTWKDFYILSPEENQSDDPALSVKLLRIARLRKNHVGVVLEVENKRESAFSAAEVTGSLLDGDDRSLPVLAHPSETIPVDGTANLVWIFDTTNAAKGSLEMRLDVPGTKTWPVVFSAAKPPDFKPTPNPGEGGQGPQGPGPMGPSGY
jgi:hypothetical protein